MADELRRFFRDYAEAFNAYDAERLAAFFHVPCVMVNDTSSALLDTPDALARSLRGLLDHHRASSVERASFDDLRIRELSPNLALVSVPWRVQRSRAPDWIFENTYNLVSYGQGWKILVSTTHDAQ